MAVKSAIEIIISAVDKASGVFQKTSSSFEKLSEKMQIWSNQNEYALTRMNNVGKQVFSSLATHISDFTEKASKTQEAQEAMDRLSKSVGANSQEILSGLQKASKGTVANYDLILAANKAMSLGVAKNTNEFTTLMEIARAKAKNMGITTTQAYNDIVTGLGRGSAMILDNLGITINAAQANEEYAKSIGKTAKELTDAEKKQALINKVVAEGKKELEASGEVLLTNAERRQKLTAQIENMQDRIGNALLPMVQRLMDAVTPLIEKFTQRAENNPQLLATIVGIIAGLSGLAVVFSSIGLAVGSLATTISVLGKAFSLTSTIVSLRWG